MGSKKLFGMAQIEALCALYCTLEVCIIIVTNISPSRTKDHKCDEARAMCCDVLLQPGSPIKTQPEPSILSQGFNDVT